MERGVAAAVLAGGASRRMGRDKATMVVPPELGGVALGLLVLEAAALVADPVVLVAPAGHAAAALAAEAGVALVTDPGEGPLAALAAALEAVDAPHLLLLAADHPGLRVELLRRLLAERGAAPAVACRRGREGRLEPLVAVYQRATALDRARGRLAAGLDYSLRGLLASLRPRVLEEAEWRPLDPDGRSFVDLDDPADLAAWQAGAGSESKRKPLEP